MKNWAHCFPQALPVQEENLMSSSEDLSVEKEGNLQGENGKVEGELVKVVVDQIEQVVLVNFLTTDINLHNCHYSKQPHLLIGAAGG